MKIAVIGAGPAGLTSAYLLSRHISGKVSGLDVYEACDHVGGLAKSIRLWDVIVDMGPHRFFSHDARVNNLWREAAGGEYEIVRRLTRIYYNNRFFHYPLKPLNVLSNLGAAESLMSVMSYIAGRLHPPADPGANFESWVVAQFGRRLYETFFKTYSEKLWGMPCAELDADFGSQRIKKLSLYEAVVNAFGVGGKNRHKTLAEEFAYPRFGTGRIYERMAEAVVNNGGRILAGRPVARALVSGGAAAGIETAGGERERYDAVISTMPLTDLVLRMQDAPPAVSEAAAKLFYRNTIIVFLNIASDSLFPDQWIYVHSKRMKSGRISNFRNWTTSLCGDSRNTAVGMEYWCSDGDATWKAPDADLIAAAKSEIASSGLLKNAAVAGGRVFRIAKSYPVYFKGYKPVLAPVTEYLRGIKNLYPIGRYGAYKYNNQDHSILMGMLAAENILDNAGHDLWAVNTDYDVYQERKTPGG